jgi:hypothetical protein
VIRPGRPGSDAVMAIPPLDTCCVVGVHEQAAEAASTGASARIHVAGWSDPHLCFLDPGSLPRPRFAHPTTTCLVDRQFTGSAPWLSQNDSSEEVGTSLARAPQFRSATVRAHTARRCAELTLAETTATDVDGNVVATPCHTYRIA